MSTRTVDVVADTIVPFKGRDPHASATVFVFRNLHHDNWSVVAQDGPHKGLVVGHAQHLVLDYARWRVNVNGRLRVIRDQAKNVHAGVYGVLADTEPTLHDGAGWERVTYNPYVAGHFYLAETDPSESHVSSSRYAMFDMHGKAWAA